MSFSTSRFRIWAVIDKQEVEVVQLSCAYEMNRIPQATIVLPVGRELGTLAPSTAHAVVESQIIQLPVEVFVEITHVAGDSAAQQIIANGKYKVFEGDATGIGYKRTPTGMALSLSLTHWLADLSFSSTLSASSHPRNPAQFTFGAAMKLQFAGDAPGAGADLRHFIGRTMAQTRITEATVVEDLWGKAILPWFIDLASSDRLNFAQLGLNDSKNQEAKKALERFDGDKLPLDFDALTASQSLAARAIANDIAVSVHDPSNNTNHYRALAHTTLWDKLVGDLAPTYMFSVIPFPEKAKVVPFIPGLQDVHNPHGTKYTIMARDYGPLDMPSKLPRALRAVAVFTGHGFRSGANLSPNDGPNALTVGGIHVARDDGMVLFKTAPRYLSEYVNGALYSGTTTGGTGKTKGNGYNNPGAGVAPGVVGPAAAKDDIKPILDKFAQALYANEVIKGRQGQLSGPIRFDIAPGSTISIEGAASAFVPNSDPQGEARYATVVRITHYFDAQTPSAGTTFNLAHIRNSGEHLSADVSVERHPLYDRKWAGDKLIEDA